MVVGEVEADGDGLKKKKNAIKVADGEEAGAEGLAKRPRGGQKIRPRKRCRTRRFAWPWD